ncbi:unnamed protein product [Didymodactylos carnosus]|uniref:MYND-type domain-containing protein n=1 Tax=Didymodactylos carnosus TaxID=1234261 RepID=A0A815FIW7_9BILA|nr:unnamed protein product [Didymodactylos carnosus]CAF1325898.1 unnamed protein product [Didymodactylos carnosus]CAF3941913.1 unnamed protein product [Didymodactylos carnosus]CAF4175563.1 unnamed protein product [Didymodactylos carnosus]
MLGWTRNVSTKPCPCGFGDESLSIKSDDRQPAFDYCSNINKLDNHVDCPAFHAICHEDRPCEPYWRFTKGSIKQIRRWCLMGEIEEIYCITRPVLVIRTRFDEKVKVHFYLEGSHTPLTFSFNDAVKGHTILIMYPEKHDFLEGTTGIRQEDGDLVVIFKCPMQTLIKTFGSMTAPQACFQCGAKPSDSIQNLPLKENEHSISSDQSAESVPMNLSLKKCSKCRIALYCNELCQTQHWKDSHKQLCSSIKYLQMLRELDFTTTSVVSKQSARPFSFAV